MSRHSVLQKHIKSLSLLGPRVKVEVLNMEVTVKKTLLTTILIVCVAGIAQAGSTPVMYSETKELYDYRLDAYLFSSVKYCYTHDNPAELPIGPYTPETYLDALAAGDILGASLTIVVDDLDKNDSVKVRIQKADGGWETLGRLNKMTFSDSFGHINGPGANPGYQTTTTFPIEPSWLGGDLPVELKMSGRWCNPNGVEFETSTLSVSVKTNPAPGAVLLGSLGAAIVT